MSDINKMEGKVPGCSECKVLLLCGNTGFLGCQSGVVVLD